MEPNNPLEVFDLYLNVLALYCLKLFFASLFCLVMIKLNRFYQRQLKASVYLSLTGAGLWAVIASFTVGFCAGMIDEEALNSISTLPVFALLSSTLAGLNFLYKLSSAHR